MNSVSFGNMVPLTQSDITRLPKHASKPAGSYYMTPDAYQGQKKKSGIGSFIKKLVVVAAALVAVKHFGKNSFLKLSTNDKAKFTIADKIKNGIVRTATAIETPCINLYNKAKTFIQQKLNNAQ